MATIIMGMGAFPSHNNSGNHPIRPSTNEPVRISNIVKEVLKQSPTEDEREVYIGLLMKDKSVTREVAAAEYDFFN